MKRFSLRKARNAAVDLLGLLIGCAVLFPLLYGVFGAFKSPAEFSAYPPTLLPGSFGYLDNFHRVFTQTPMLRYFLNSFLTSLLSALIRLLLAVLAAYAFAFFDFRGKSFLFFLLLGTMMLPADTLTITNYQTVSRLGLLDSYLGIIIVSLVGASQMFMLRQHFLSSPLAVREAAQIDGCGDLKFLLGILLPMSMPLLLTLFLQAFIAQWNAYLWPLLVTNTDAMRTVQVGVTMLTTIEGTNYETILAGAAVTMVPGMLLFLLLRRSITRTMGGGAIVG